MKRIRQLALLLAALAWCVPAHATFTTVNGNNGTTSPLTLGFSVGSGHGLYVEATSSAAGTAMTAASCSPTCGTLTHCPSANGSDATAGSVDCYYTLSATAAATPTVSVTMTSLTSIHVEDFSFTSGPISVDTSGTRDNNSNATSVPGVTLTLTGSNDIIFQGAGSSGNISAVSAGWTEINAAFPNGDGGAFKANTTDGTAITWTQSSGRNALMAIAFTESGGAAVSGISKERKLDKHED